MSELAITLIDVGWGDTILLESQDGQGARRFALIDCNDSTYDRSGYLHVKRFFERERMDYRRIDRNFDWVLLTHGHADHAQGLKQMLRTFGTERFWYPKSVASTSYGDLLRYANRAPKRVGFHQAVDRTKILPAFGDASLEILWPDYGQVDQRNENNNSVVLQLTLGQISIVLTGDAEAENWPHIVPRASWATLRVFQSPHHGALNGVFDGAETPWLDALPGQSVVAMSSHIEPHGHPHPNVIAEFQARQVKHYRTDQHAHLRFWTDGQDVRLHYSHDELI